MDSKYIWIALAGVGIYVAWQYYHSAEPELVSTGLVPKGVVSLPPTVTTPVDTSPVKLAIEKGTISPSILVDGAYRTGVQRVEGGPELNVWQWNYVLNMLTGLNGPPPSSDDATPIKAGVYLSRIS